MERNIPDLFKFKLMDVLFDEEEERTAENYAIHLYEFECQCEKTLLEIFGKLDFQASVKKDKYSLPYREEIVHTILGGSDLIEAFNFTRAARTIVKELLQKDIYKFRFYMFINIIESSRNIADIIPLPNAEGKRYLVNFGSMEYRFRYYVH
jgi:hypothetical protein